MFLNCSTCFGRHTAHHQELKNCNCSPWFDIRFWLLVAGCRCDGWVGTQFPLSHRSGQQAKTYVKPEAAITVFELLIMGGVSSETCWAIKKHWNKKFYYTAASCWFFFYEIYITMHGFMNIKFVRMFLYESLNSAYKPNFERSKKYVGNILVLPNNYGRLLFWKKYRNKSNT